MEWFGTSLMSIIGILVSTIGIYAAVILFTRINGLRTFSKMSSFDFAITIASGSIIASTLLNPRPSLLEGATALAVLFACQHFISWMRIRGKIDRFTDNQPVLLMLGSTFLQKSMQEARVTEEDIMSKLREANVLDLAEIKAVILETTGDISVLHGQEQAKLSSALLKGVKKLEPLDNL